MDVAKRLASEPQNVAFSADVFRISRRSLLSELDIGTVRQFGPLFGLSHYLSFGLSPVGSANNAFPLYSGRFSLT
ncbi:hypothetical protein, partial [Alistipes shahii]|uniref:hypothetical protein n=1 Tax=Alistipes shahii TaxID=328814 RepID=UPI003079C8A5